MTGLKYYQLSPPPISASITLLTDYYALVNDRFDLSSNLYTIQRETSFGSNSFVDAQARITSMIDNATGQKLSDDFKQLIFKPSDTHVATLGTLYYFANNYWLAVYSDTIKSLSNNCMVRRCNDYLRWVDENGKYYKHPCIIDYGISRPKDVMGTENPVLPAGYTNVYCQLNSDTELIRGDQRFLFGRPNNRISWKVFGNAVQNTQNQSTIDPTSSTLLTLTMGGWQRNADLDNEALGIADYYKYLYALSLTPSTLSGNVGETHQLTATVTLNGNPVAKPVTFVSSNAAVASTSASGLITMSASGVAIITSVMVDNSSASATSTVTVTTSGTSSSAIRVTPSDDTFILEDESKVFTVYLYNNGVQQADAFTFAVANSNVPVANYSISAITANGFTVTNNNKYMDYPLLINATSGSYLKQISVEMRGAW